MSAALPVFEAVFFLSFFFLRFLVLSSSFFFFFFFLSPFSQPAALSGDEMLSSVRRRTICVFHPTRTARCLA